MPNVTVFEYTKVRVRTGVQKRLNRHEFTAIRLSMPLISRVRGSLTVCQICIVRLRWSLLWMLPLSVTSMPFQMHLHCLRVRPYWTLSVDDPAILPVNGARLLRLTVRALAVHPSGLASFFTSSAGCGIQVLASGSPKWSGNAFLAIQLGSSGSEGFASELSR